VFNLLVTRDAHHDDDDDDDDADADDVIVMVAAHRDFFDYCALYLLTYLFTYLLAGRGQLLYTQHPFNASLKHLLPQTHAAVKECRALDARHLCFLAG